MITTAISIFAIVALVNWLKWKVSTRALVYFMLKKEYTPPSDQEMKACTEYVAQEMFKDLFSTRT